MNEDLARLAEWQANDGTAEEYERECERERKEIAQWHRQAYIESQEEWF